MLKYISYIAYNMQEAIYTKGYMYLGTLTYKHELYIGLFKYYINKESWNVTRSTKKRIYMA